MDFKWRKAGIKSKVRNIYKRLTDKQLQSKHYCNTIVLDTNKGAQYLYKLILSEQPFMAARYGFNEIEAMAGTYYYLETKKSKKLDKIIKKGNLFNGAGFFPEDKQLVIDFGKMMLEASGYVDLMGIWYIPYEEYFINKFSNNPKITYLNMFEPWNEEIPWTKALKGKKVLVVHPFVKTIEKQYKKREKLFENRDILPEFELVTYKAVQTIAGTVDPRFKTWFEALEYMYNDIMKLDFDIAILGCGAYGFPLAAKFKRAGKQAVHMGGATQLLFGIKGSRWDNHPIVSKLYNEYWTRPDVSETPGNAGSVENKCYW